LPIEPRRLRDFALTRNIPEDAVAELAQCTQPAQAAANTVVARRGGRGVSVYLVLEGQLLGLVPSIGGKEVVTDTLKPGDIFGELAALDGGARVRMVRSETDVTLGQVDAADFDAWLTRTPAAMRNLLADMASRARVMTDRLFEIAVHDVETRVRLFLIRLLIEAGELRDGGVLDPAPSQNLIAAHVGANREAVSRAISRFAKAGMLERSRQRVVVRDVRALEHGGL